MFAREKWYRPLRKDLPHTGAAGTRLALIHIKEEQLIYTHNSEPGSRIGYKFYIWLGLVGSLLISIGGIGGGCIPVVNNVFSSYPAGGYLARIPDICAVVVMIGVCLMVIAWIGILPYTGMSIPGITPVRDNRKIDIPTLLKAAVAWCVPLLITAPLFSQDIYSYLAQGAITAQNMDPYSAGPVDLLGIDDPLARSVPNAWAHSPAPYGPLATGLAALISVATNNSLLPSIIIHRLLSVLAVVLITATIPFFTRRLSIQSIHAYWFISLNPLTTLHLIAGIHNDSLMIALIMLGFVAAYKAYENTHNKTLFALWFFVAAALISLGGLVKVPAFMALGFLVMGGAHALLKNVPSKGKFLSSSHSLLQGLSYIFVLIIWAVCALVATIAFMSYITDLGLGWIFVQGGATDVLSWRSVMTLLGVLASFILQLAGAGNHTSSVTHISWYCGFIIIAICVVRCLWANYVGKLGTLPAYSIAMAFVVLFFPVVHPWYVLWAVIPISLYANRPSTRVIIIMLSAFMSLSALPRSVDFGIPLTISIFITAFFLAGLFFSLSRMLVHKYAHLLG